MGELSKKIGDEGEELINQFLDRIGWTKTQRQYDIDCEKRDEHQRKGSKSPRRTHGGDILFSYICPFIPGVRRNILVSVKNSNFEKTGMKVTTVTDDLKELNMLINCFEVSERRSNLQLSGGANVTTDIGLLIRINRDPDSERSFLGENGIEQVQLEGSNPIYFVENDRFDFIDCCMEYLKRNFGDRENKFYIHKNSLNLSGEVRRMESAFLPVQNLVAGPIAIRSSLNAEKDFILFSDQEFSEFCLEKMIGIALACSNGWASRITIVFHGYDRTKKDAFDAVIAKIDDSSFSSSVTCDSFTVKSRLK